MDEVLEGLRALERTGIGDEHATDRPVPFRHGKDRPHALRDESLQGVPRLRHDPVLEHSVQAEHAHIVVAYEARCDLEGITCLLGEPVSNLGTATTGREHLACRPDVRGSPLPPLVHELRRRGGDPHTHRPRTGPFQSQRIGNGEADKLSSMRLRDVDGMPGDALGRRARTEPDENPLDHGVASGWTRARRAWHPGIISLR